MDRDPVAEVRERPDDRAPDAPRPSGYQHSPVSHGSRLTVRATPGRTGEQCVKNEHAALSRPWRAALNGTAAMVRMSSVTLKR